MAHARPELTALTPSRTREILAELDHQPKRSLGQNFLIDGNIVDKSLELGEIAQGDYVVEIGPGLGALTRGLLRRGAEVYAIELDSRLVDWLQKSIGTHPYLHLAAGDACAMPLARLDPLEAPAFKIIANLPYSISSTWMEAVLSQLRLPERIVILVQRETADRMTAEPGSKAVGAISVFLQGAYERLPGHPVPASCFYPVPKVDSTLFHLVRKKNPYRYGSTAREAIRLLFTQRRKQIGSLARQFFEPALADAWMEVIRGFGGNPYDRPEQLPFEAWRGLAELIEE